MGPGLAMGRQGVKGGMPNGRGINGADANLNLSSSDSCSLFVFALLFWNQIFT